MKTTGKCLFLGSKRLGLLCLEKLLTAHRETVSGAITLDDASDGRSELRCFLDLAAAHDLPLHILPSGCSLAEHLKTYQPALVLTCGWYFLIEPELLAVPPLGFVGFHNSLLPKYRGGAPLVWAIINGETEAGFSFFKFTPGLDDGPLFAQESVIIEADDTISDVLTKIEHLAPATLLNCYQPLLAGRLEARPQQGSPTYSAQRQPEDGRINWRMPQRRIYDFIRAQSRPYPGAYALFEGRPVTFWRVKPVELVYYGSPGQVVHGQDKEVMVVCGDHKPLLVEEISIENTVARNPEDVLGSLKIRLS